jgi:ParB-like chromosome segregation protein Spo0J
VDKIKSVADLKHDRRNPRKHNERNLKVIVDSLHDVGFARSIVIDENNEILAGNGVTEAAVLAGMEKVVEVEADGNTIIAVKRTGLTEEQKQRLKYFDNRAGELAEWDAETLLADLNIGVDLKGALTKAKVA